MDIVNIKDLEADDHSMEHGPEDFATDEESEDFAANEESDDLAADEESEDLAANEESEDETKDIPMDQESENNHVDQESDVLFGNAGWADAMNRILNTKKPKKKKSIILAKAKKLSSLKKPITEETDEKTGAEGKEKKEETYIRKADWLNIGHTKPQPLDRNRERQLQKLTVRGVIALFNAVNQHQKNMITTPVPVLTKKEKRLKSINKDKFLDILTKGSSSIESLSATKNETDENEVKGEEVDLDGEDNTWSVLKSNFMKKSKWKNWDKESENVNEMNA